MLITRLESRFRQLGLPPERPRVLLALPLVATMSADGPISLSEGEAMCRFARHVLDFDSGQMRFLQRWIASPPHESTVRDALQLLENILEAPDLVTVEHEALEAVLMECERLLRRREQLDLQRSTQGRRLLQLFCSRLKLDLGSAWQDVAPEVFLSGNDPTTDPNEEKKDQPKSRRGAVRRWETALRQSTRSRVESGGLV